jgi:hypothetical protein
MVLALDGYERKIVLMRLVCGIYLIYENGLAVHVAIMTGLA